MMARLVRQDSKEIKGKDKAPFSPIHHNDIKTNILKNKQEKSQSAINTFDTNYLSNNVNLKASNIFKSTGKESDDGYLNSKIEKLNSTEEEVDKNNLSFLNSSDEDLYDSIQDKKEKKLVCQTKKEVALKNKEFSGETNRTLSSYILKKTNEAYMKYTNPNNTVNFRGYQSSKVSRNTKNEKQNALKIGAQLLSSNGSASTAPYLSNRNNTAYNQNSTNQFHFSTGNSIGNSNPILSPTAQNSRQTTKMPPPYYKNFSSTYSIKIPGHLDTQTESDKFLTSNPNNPYSNNTNTYDSQFRSNINFNENIFSPLSNKNQNKMKNSFGGLKDKNGVNKKSPNLSINTLPSNRSPLISKESQTHKMDSRAFTDFRSNSNRETFNVNSQPSERKINSNNTYNNYDPSNVLFLFKGGRIDFMRNPSKTDLAEAKKYYMKEIELLRNSLFRFAVKRRIKTHKIIRIQSFWRGYWLRYRLYHSIYRYYIGRAFIAHLRKLWLSIIKRKFEEFVKKTKETIDKKQNLKLSNLNFNSLHSLQNINSDEEDKIFNTLSKKRNSLNQITCEFNIQILDNPKQKIFFDVRVCKNNSFLEILQNKDILLEIKNNENFEIIFKRKQIPNEVSNSNDKDLKFDIFGIKKESTLSPILSNSFEIKVIKKIPKFEIIQNNLINLISNKIPFDYTSYIKEKSKFLNTIRCENINITEKRKIPENHIFSNPNIEILKKKKQSIFNPQNLDCFELKPFDANSTLCLLKKFDKKTIKCKDGIKTLLLRGDIEINKNIDFELICKKLNKEISTSISQIELLKMNNIYLQTESTNNNLELNSSYPKVIASNVIKEYINKKLQSLELSFSNKNSNKIIGIKKINKFEVLKEDRNKLSFSLIYDSWGYINKKSLNHAQLRTENISFGLDKKSYQIIKSKINKLNIAERITFDVDRKLLIRNKNANNLYNRQIDFVYEVDKKSYHINKSKYNISDKVENIMFNVDQISYLKNKSLKYNISKKESNVYYGVEKSNYQNNKSKSNVTIKVENINFEVDTILYIKNKSKSYMTSIAQNILYDVDLSSYLKSKNKKNFPKIAENLYIEKITRAPFVKSPEVIIEYNKYKSNTLKNISKKLQEKFEKNSLYKFIIWKEKIRNSNVKNNLKKTLGIKKTINLILKSNQRFVLNNLLTSLVKIYTEKLKKEIFTSILNKLSFYEKFVLITNFNKWRIIGNKIKSHEIFNKKDKHLEEMTNLKNKFEDLSEQKEKDILKTKEIFEKKLYLIRIYKSHEKYLQKIINHLKLKYLSFWAVQASSYKYSKIIEKTKCLVNPKTFKLFAKIVCYRKNFVALSHKTQYLLHIKRRHGEKDYFYRWLSTISKLKENEKNNIVRVKSIKMNIIKKSVTKLIESSGSDSSESEEIESPFNSSILNRSSMSQDKFKFRSISKTIQKENLTMLDFNQKRNLKIHFLKWKNIFSVVPISGEINRNTDKINSSIYLSKNQNKSSNIQKDQTNLPLISFSSQFTFENLQVTGAEFVEFKSPQKRCYELNNIQLDFPEINYERDSISQSNTLDNYHSNRSTLNPITQQPYRLKSRPNTIVNTQNQSEPNLSIDQNVTHANFTLNTHKTNDSFNDADESFEDVAIGGAIEIQAAWRNYKLRQYFEKYSSWLKILHALVYNLKDKNKLILVKFFIKWKKDMISHKVGRASEAITSSLSEKIKNLRTKRKSLSYDNLNKLFSTYLHFKIIQQGFKILKMEYLVIKGTTKLINHIKINFLKKFRDKYNIKLKNCNKWDRFSETNLIYNQETPQKMNLEVIEREIYKKAIQQYKNFLSKMQHFFSKYENINIAESTKEALRSWFRKMKLLRRKDHSMLKMVKIILNQVRRETFYTIKNKLSAE